MNWASGLAPFNPLEEARALAYDGYDMEQAAAELGVNYNTLAGWVRRYGLKFVRKNGHNRKPVVQPALPAPKAYSHPQQAVIERYFYTRATLRETAEACGLHIETTRQIIKNLGLVRKPVADLTKHHSLSDCGLRRCCDCHEIKPEDAFYWATAARQRRDSRCKECVAAYVRSRYHDDSTGDKAKRLSWMRSDTGRESQRKASSRWYRKKKKMEQQQGASND